MNSDDFETQARLYVLGALDEDELVEFEKLRHGIGARAESIILECERLNSMFALSLKPTPPKPTTKQRLLDMINTGFAGRSQKLSKDHRSSGN